MRTIWKYALGPMAVQTFGIPSDAVILCVREQDNEICIWADLDSDNSQEERTFEIAATGQQLSPITTVRRYLGTAMLDGGRFVFHVYERSAP